MRRSTRRGAVRDVKGALFGAPSVSRSLRCRCGRVGAYAIIIWAMRRTAEERVCCVPQCKHRRRAEQSAVDVIRAYGGAGEIRPIDWRAPHTSEPLPRPLAA